ncbi:hypothetical protein TNCV_344491 [Trichonephila clavipes]|nr:hypothetical protein TNCV_344491 [Trichonephila clavipes]
MLSSRPGAIYQQDNASSTYCATLPTMSFQGYDVLPWPARSPDLSPIEHVWTRWEGNCSRPEIQRINCADAKTMAGSSTGGDCTSPVVRQSCPRSAKSGRRPRLPVEVSGKRRRWTASLKPTSVEIFAYGFSLMALNHLEEAASDS